jgi:hypothetical protein
VFDVASANGGYCLQYVGGTIEASDPDGQSISAKLYRPDGELDVAVRLRKTSGLVTRSGWAKAKTGSGWSPGTCQQATS